MNVQKKRNLLWESDDQKPTAYEGLCKTLTSYSQITIHTPLKSHLLTERKRAELISCCATQEMPCPGLPAAPHIMVWGAHLTTPICSRDTSPRSWRTVQPTEACRDDTRLTPTPHLCNTHSPLASLAFQVGTLLLDTEKGKSNLLTKAGRRLSISLSYTSNPNSKGGESHSPKLLTHPMT